MGPPVGADPVERARLARWHAGTTWKLAGQSFELEGRVADTLMAYAECVRLNPDDAVLRSRIELLRRLYPTAEPAGSPPRAGAPDGK